MHHGQLILHVRQLAHDTLRRLEGRSELQPVESILVRDGYYFGRRFSTDRLEAVWTFEDNRIHVYRRDGSLVHVQDVDQRPGTARPEAA